MSTKPNNLNPSHRNPITLCLCLALLCCAGYYTTQSYLDYKRSEHLKVNGIPYRTPTKMTLSMLTEDPRNPKKRDGRLQRCQYKLRGLHRDAKPTPKPDRQNRHDGSVRPRKNN